MLPEVFLIDCLEMGGGRFWFNPENALHKIHVFRFKTSKIMYGPSGYLEGRQLLREG